LARDPEDFTDIVGPASFGIVKRKDQIVGELIEALRNALLPPIARGQINEHDGDTATTDVNELF
jgi:hypothetical protein